MPPTGNVADGVLSKRLEETETRAMDIQVFEPDVLQDERGWFCEAFKLAEFEGRVGSRTRFVQDNHSRSRKGVLRGLHYQVDPMAQGKLVRAVHGEIFDVAVDVRRSSPGFGQWHGVILSSDNFKQIWIPPGYAHGFLSLSEDAEVLYKVTEYYSPAHERSVRWDDPDIGIDWPLDGTPTLSHSDQNAPLLRDAEPFE